MNKFRYISIVCGLVFILSGCGQTNSPLTEAPVSIPVGNFYFFSQNCSHCANVDNYITQNNVRQKFYFISQNVGVDSGALDLVKMIGKQCGILDKDLAVPLFWDGVHCYLGDTDVINYFKTKL